MRLAMVSPLLLLLLCTIVVSVSCTATDSNGTSTSWFSSTSTPTASGSGSIPDRGTYWPWNTPRGVLPASVKVSWYNAQINPPQETYSYHVICQTNPPTNNGVPTIPYYGNMVDYAVTNNHTYYRVTFSSLNSALLWYNSVTSVGVNAAVIGGGWLRQSLISNPTTFPCLLLRYSFLISDNIIPSSVLTSYSYYTYYVTARSSMGEFRMITYTNYADAIKAFQGITQEYTITNYNQTQQRVWDTVKVFYGGYVYWSDSLSRGSELEHQGAFQWLSLPPPYSRYTSPYYYLLVSFTTLSGVTLERMHSYSTYAEAAATQQWIWWYTSTYEPYSYRASSLMYYQRQLYNFMTQYTFNQIPLQQHFNWITGYSNPTPYPYYPYYPQTNSPWSDLSSSQITFIIAYPTCWVVAALVVVLIVNGCLKRRSSTISTPSSVPACVDRLKCVYLFLSITSLTLLIISLSLKRFSNASLSGGYFEASYGPFQVQQTIDYSVWSTLNKNAQVMSPITGVCMIISMIASALSIRQIKCAILSYRLLLFTLIAFLFSLIAIIIFLPVHIRLQDHTLDFTVTQGYPGYRLTRSVGAGFILLFSTTIIHAGMFIISCVIYKKYRQTTTQPQQQEVEGLQLVNATSPYYYRDVPTTTDPSAIMAVPVPAYMYGVQRPTAPPTAPPPFMFAAVPASGYPYAAPMYYPPPPAAAPVAEPLYQPISAPVAYTAPAVPAAAPVPASAPAPTPAPVPASYPSLPVDVPASGPNTDYQRLL